MADKHLKTCSTSSLQIQSMVKYHFHPLSGYEKKKKRQIITRVDKDVEKLKPSYFTGENGKLCSYSGKQFLGSIA